MSAASGTQPGGIDLSRAVTVTSQVQAAIDDMFDYNAWNKEQTQAGQLVRDALVGAFAIIVANVPPSPDRSAAMRKLRECRMDCNSAISHGGRY